MESKERFEKALNRVIDQVKEDRTILAAILCGSMSYDTVWSKSDIDLVLVTIDDKKMTEGMVALTEEGVNIHAILVSRSDFRKTADGSRRNSFMHSFYTKGRVLYSHDPSIGELFETLGKIGQRDTEDQLLRAGIDVLPSLYKAQKWFHVRKDFSYAALWLLRAAVPLAQIEVFSHRQLADREVILQALQLNPEFFTKIYLDLLEKPKTEARVRAALEAVERYLRERREALFQPILDYLRDAGEIRSATEIENEFTKQRNISCASFACEYLSDEGLITKASTPMKLTRKSNVQVSEMAFVHLGEPPEF